MNYEYYKTLIGEYINLGRSEERLLGELGYPEEIKLDTDNFIKAVAVIAAVADANMKRLVELSEMSMTAFARMFRLPYRSLQNWCADVRTPPEYVPMLIGYILIMQLEDAGNGDI